MAAINELLSAVAAEEAAQLSVERREGLPWTVRANVGGGGDGGGEAGVNENDSHEEIDDELDALPPLSNDEIRDHDNIHVAGDASFSTAATSHSSTQPRIRSRQLQMLAPLLDRLGRTLVDAAPHVAALANASSDNDTEESISTAEAVVSTEQAEEHNPSTLGGLLSLLSRDRRRSSNTNNNNPPGENVDEPSSPPQEHLTWPVDPDYVDFATGSVNTTRGEVRSGPRSRSSNDEVAGLLGAYLAAASLGLGNVGGSGEADGNDDAAGNVLGLGRLLRERGGGGNGGGGIDIHIHAVVTAPGMPPTTLGGGGPGGGGGLGFATLGAPPAFAGAAARNSLSPPSRDRRGSGGNSLLRLRTPTVAEEEDDLGLFSDLYSESPAPVDHNATPEDRAGTSSRREESASTSDNDFLARLSQPARRTSGSGQGSMHHDPVSSTPRRRTNSEASSSRRSSTDGSSPRRGSVLSRLFRRSRRSSSGNGGS